jgi:putative hydrolase of HD superfamily
MSLIHDLAECIVGDLAPADGVTKEDKANRERVSLSIDFDSWPLDLISYFLGQKAAMLSLTSMIGSCDTEAGELIWNLYTEYEQHASPESNYVKSLDLFDMYLQAYEYEHVQNMNLSEFYANVPFILDSAENSKNKNFSPQVRSWLAELNKIRDDKKNLLPFDSNLNTVLKCHLEGYK